LAVLDLFNQVLTTSASYAQQIEGALLDFGRFAGITISGTIPHLTVLRVYIFCGRSGSLVTSPMRRIWKEAHCPSESKNTMSLISLKGGRYPVGQSAAGVPQVLWDITFAIV
jgi:hypothetical protein